MLPSPNQSHLGELQLDSSQLQEESRCRDTQEESGTERRAEEAAGHTCGPAHTCPLTLPEADADATAEAAIGVAAADLYKVSGAEGAGAAEPNLEQKPPRPLLVEPVGSHART